MLRDLFNNSRGNSYIQVIMASSAIAGLALVGLKLEKQQREVADSLYGKYLVNYLHQEVVHILSRPEDCRESLKGLNPQGDDFTHLKKFMKEKSKRRSREVFSLSHQKDSHIYFDNKVAIKKYSLVKNDENYDENIAKLLVTYQFDQEEFQQIEKVSFKQVNGKITACQLLLPQEKYSLNIWKREDGVVKTPFNRVVLGREPHKKLDISAGLALEETSDKNEDDLRAKEDSKSNLKKKKREFVHLKGGLYLEPVIDEADCDAESEGSLIHYRDYGLRFCFAGKWYPFGAQRPALISKDDFHLKLMKEGTKTYVTDKFRYCFLTKVKKQSSKDGCWLERVQGNEIKNPESNPEQIYSEYKFSIYSSAARTLAECEASCVH